MKAALLLFAILGACYASEYLNVWRTERLFNGGCGDGLIQRGEQCDDFNQRNGDGCSSDCQLEDDEESSNTAIAFRIRTTVTLPSGEIPLKISFSSQVFESGSSTDGPTIVQNLQMEQKNEFGSQLITSSLIEQVKEVVASAGKGLLKKRAADGFCGDGIVQKGEQCDVGNSISLGETDFGC